MEAFLCGRVVGTENPSRRHCPSLDILCLTQSVRKFGLRCRRPLKHVLVSGYFSVLPGISSAIFTVTLRLYMSIHPIHPSLFPDTGACKLHLHGGEPPVAGTEKEQETAQTLNEPDV